MKINIDFYIHWLWVATFGILALTGFTLMGPRYGWILNYALAAADYLHRTMAAIFTILLASAIALEILKLLFNVKVTLWMMIGTGPYQLFTLITTLLLIISGLFIWICMEWSMSALAFALTVHEIVSFLAVGSLIWHIYQKAHTLRI